MRKLVFLIFAFASAAPSLAQTAFPRTQGALTWQRREAGWSPAWFICDGIDRPVIQLVGALDARAGVTVWTYQKAGFRTARAPYIAGNDEAGMSQLVTPLFPYPRGKRAAGSFTSFNPAVLPVPASATTGTFSSLQLGATRTRCRWVPNTRVQLFTPRRSIVITREGGDYVYRSFDFSARTRVTADGRSTIPSLVLRGGRIMQGAHGGELGATVYAFANGRYAYRVSVSNNPREPGSALRVTRDGRTLSTEITAGYTTARP